MKKISVLRRVKIYKPHFILIVLVFILVGSSITSCKKPQEISADARLTFSTDTVFFDTVFTSIGSVTQVCKIYNKHEGIMHIDQIKLNGGSNSMFRLAVDGDNGTSFEDIDLYPGDSLYMFVQVTVDPNDETFPFIAEDKIDIIYNNTRDEVYTAAWGQNAYFHGGPDALTTLSCHEVWNNDKPHVVYGVLEIEPNCDLTINAGCQVYLHKGAGILVNEGRLFVQGQKGSEVVFQGDRLEAEYQDVPGQWGIELDFQIGGSQGPDIYTISRGGIWIYKSPGSVIDYAIVKNGNTGIQVDTTGTSAFALTLTNTKIDNMAGVGLWGQGAHIQAVNLLSSNCGEGCAYLSIGGKYVMDNCTFANYWSGGVRTAPAFALNNYYKDINQNIQVRPLYQCRFQNCIMYGNSATLEDFGELVVDVEFPENQDYLFSYCLIDFEDVTNDNHWDNIINHQAPFFCDVYNNDFHISSNSSRMIGGPFNSGILDLDQQETGFWKGCYDYTGNCE
ncbi:MAG: hypothetical protein RL362_45 [Bacteroidota bacterium]